MLKRWRAVLGRPQEWGADVNGLPRAGTISFWQTTTFMATPAVSSASRRTRLRAAAFTNLLPQDSARYRLAMLRHRRRQSATNTVADLLEPIPGQAGIIVPADDLPATSSTTC